MNMALSAWKMNQNISFESVNDIMLAQKYCIVSFTIVQ